MPLPQRTFLRLLSVLLLVALPVTTPGPAHAADSSPDGETAPPRPNIVFVVTDDLDTTSVAFMPRVRGLLAREGVTFSAAFVSSPLCAPSRASTLTGRYPHNTGVLGNSAPTGGFGAFLRSEGEKDTIATRLRDAGYRTGLVGKYLNEYPMAGNGRHVGLGWDFWSATQGDAPYLDFLMNIDGAQRYFPKSSANYSTDVIRDRALEFIRQSRSDPQHRPFFLYVATVAPHFPALPAPRHAEEFPDAEAPRAPSFDEADVSDKPPWIRAHQPLDAHAKHLLTKLYGRRLRTMLAVDEMVEAIVTALAETGQDDRTYIFFTSDNGFLLGEHRCTKGKGLVYEESIRVPLIVRGPGVPHGTTLPHLVSNVDFFPTWLQLAGASVPPHADGRSLVPLLGAAPPPLDKWRADLLVEFLAAGEEEAPPFHLLRTYAWSWAEYAGGVRELYDLDCDPYQLENRAGSAPEPVRRALAARLEAVMRCSGENCP